VRLQGQNGINETAAQVEQGGVGAFYLRFSMPSWRSGVEVEFVESTLCYAMLCYAMPMLS